MAQKEVIEIEAKTDKALKELEALREEIGNLSKAQEQTAKSTGKIASSIGTLTKGAVIGIALKAFEAFSEVLSKNQKVADFFSVTLEAVSKVFNDLVNFILDNTQPVVDTFKAIFDDPLGSIEDLGNAIKENLIERFNSFIETLGFLGKAAAALFRGKFEEAAELAKEAGKELVDVYTGVDGSAEKLAKAVKQGAEALTEYAKETIKTAKTNVELAKTAEKAAVLNQGLIAQYGKQAEKLRQVRDEERNTLEERVAANNKLNEVLDKQEKAMLANANAILASAQAQYNKNNSQENELALLEAKNELLDVEEQIEGFRSEQKQNDLALSRELAQVDRDAAEAAIDALETEKRAKIEVMDSEKEKIEATIKLEEELHTKRLNLINERLKAEQEGSTAYSEILAERVALEAEYAAIKKTNQKEEQRIAIDLKQQEEDAKLNITASALSAAQGLAEEGSAMYKGLAVAQVVLDTFKGIQAAFASNAANVGATTLTGGAWPFIQAAAAGAFGAANIAGILAVDPKGKSTSTPSISRSSGATVATNVSGPQFNTVAAVQQSRLLGDISGALNQPQRAYVVAGDVTTAQELSRKRIKNSSF